MRGVQLMHASKALRFTHNKAITEGVRVGNGVNKPEVVQWCNGWEG